MASVPAKTMLKGIDILDVFVAAAGRPLGLTEISRRSGINKKSTHRLLLALASRGLLRYDAAIEKYRLGLRLAEYGFAAQRASPLVEMVTPVLGQLRDLTGETATIALREGDVRVYGAAALSPQSLRWVPGIGQSYPLYLGAVGIVFASERSDAEVQAMLDHGGFFAAEFPIEHTALERAVMQGVQEMRRTGNAIYVPEGAELGAIAFALHTPNRQILAAIVVAGPKDRFSRERITLLRDRLARLVGELERQTGFP